MDIPGRQKGPGGFQVVSLGCRVNQAEAGAVARDLLDRGWARAGEDRPADLVVLLTCAVTATASRQSRQMARRLVRDNPGTLVTVTGCDPQVDQGPYLKAGARVLGRAHLARLAHLASSDEPWPGGVIPAHLGPWSPGRITPGGGRSRGLLKVQDGCDAHCAYCIVPHTRGLPRSLPLDQAREDFRSLGKAGAGEVVLTGIHLGRWGRDLPSSPGPPLETADLVIGLLEAHPGPRIRLSSLESHEVTPRLVELLAREERLCRHLHLPLQSGDRRVLAAMGRPYGPEEYARAVLDLHRAREGVCLGADVLVGLPGEDEAAFRNTLELIGDLPLSYLHVFPYSPRPGTPAATMPGRPDPREAKARAAALRKLGRAKKADFLGSLKGMELRALVEGNGLGRTGNYALVKLDRDIPPGETVRVEITATALLGKEAGLRGRVLD